MCNQRWCEWDCRTPLRSCSHTEHRSTCSHRRGHHPSHTARRSPPDRHCCSARRLASSCTPSRRRRSIPSTRPLCQDTMHLSLQSTRERRPSPDQAHHCQQSCAHLPGRDQAQDTRSVPHSMASLPRSAGSRESWYRACTVIGSQPPTADRRASTVSASHRESPRTKDRHRCTSGPDRSQQVCRCPG